MAGFRIGEPNPTTGLTPAPKKFMGYDPSRKLGRKPTPANVDAMKRRISAAQRYKSGTTTS